MGALLKEMFLQVFPTVLTHLNDKVVKMLPPTIQLLLRDERLVVLDQLDAILSPKLIASILKEIPTITTALEKSLAPKINFRSKALPNRNVRKWPK